MKCVHTRNRFVAVAPCKWAFTPRGQPLADWGGGAGTEAPIGVKLLSISCSVREKIWKNNSFLHSSLDLAPLPWGNPGSATGSPL